MPYGCFVLEEFYFLKEENLMKIYKGSSRTVLQVGSIVIKFPKYFYALSSLFNIEVLFLSRKIYYNELNFVNKKLMDGIISNASEYGSYLLNPSSFKVPVFFSIGIFSIQKYQNGVIPSDIWKLLNKLPQEAQEQLKNMDMHAFEESNFILTKYGIKMVDYGDKFASGWGLSNFLRQWDKELDELFKTQRLT